jgi:hypothetical protein
MQTPRSSFRLPAFAFLAVAATLWSACADQSPTAPSGPMLSVQQVPGLRTAMAAQERHTDSLLRIQGVVGTAVGRLPNGQPVVRIFLAHAGVRNLPAALDGVPTRTEVTGLFMARSDPTTQQRPAPLGFSVGHPAITAGTIGARVVDGSGNVYVLSNNHVLANSNDANIGDPEYQPGPYDGGTATDQFATLSAFKSIVFTSTASNTIDAAIALSNPTNLGNATPTDDGYGAPSSTIFGDADGDGLFDNKNDLLGLEVQKYGRTTKLTTGQITGINATVSICYEALLGILCLKSAQFVDQIIIGPAGFSDGGDSGSLIVTNDGNENPVALLFAGSSTETIANRIDLVLNEFDVTIDGGSSTLPTPVTDIAITSVNAPTSVTQGGTADVQVTVRNVGNQDVAAGFGVTLEDETDGVGIGTQSVSGLAAGAQATLSFSWNTTASSAGSHTLTASHDFADDDASNDQASTTTSVYLPGTGDGIHVGDLDGSGTRNGKTWYAVVEVTVHDVSHNPINGATVVGVWDPAGLASDECTTGEGGGNGTCIFLFPLIAKKVRSVSFTVTNITMTGKTYVASDNHDVDGSSNGTVVVVQRP